MKLIKRGAEADVYLTTWNSKPAILKHRKEKPYRHPTLDERLRRQRTIRESEIISLVKSYGIPSPLVYFVDAKGSSIIMQYIPGDTVSSLQDDKFVVLCKDIGKLVGIMHQNGIMHGDLTTSNFLYYQEKVFVIDFGLAIRTKKPEDHSVDLRLIKEILNSAHAHVMENAWKNFLAGYKSVVGKTYFEKITSLVALIESRGRYATVV